MQRNLVIMHNDSLGQCSGQSVTHMYVCMHAHTRKLLTLVHIALISVSHDY